MTHIYSLNDFYIGQTHNPKTRLEQHKWEALKFYQTKKDHLVWDAMTSTGLQLECLFETDYPDGDETFTTMVFREQGFNLCNVAAGLSLNPVERVTKLPSITEACRKFFVDAGIDAPEATPIANRQGRLNSVIHEYKMKELRIEVARVEFKENAYGGANTPIIYFKWLNTNQPGEENLVQGDFYRGRYKTKPYTDSQHHCHDMKVGERYVVYSQRVPSPDDPKETSFWSWERYHLMGAEYRAAFLADRLRRIEVARGLPDFKDMVKQLDNLEQHTIDGFYSLNNYTY